MSLSLIGDDGRSYAGLTRGEFDEMWNYLPPYLQSLDQHMTIPGKAHFVTVSFRGTTYVCVPDKATLDDLEKVGIRSGRRQSDFEEFV